MFIDSQIFKRGKKKYRRVLLRNSYRKNGKVCHDTIANLSKCDEEEVEAIKFALANKDRIKALEATDLKIKTLQGLSMGAIWLLNQMAKRLGIVKALGNSVEAKLSLWMVIACVLGCVSRLSAARLGKRHAVCDVLNLNSFCEDDLYKAMDWLADNQKSIEKKLFHFRHKDKKPNLYLYDVTSSYLEGDQNELGAYGYNRDKKTGKKQIVIGLLTDDEGCPISSEVFQGNTQDPQTFKNQIDKLAHQFGIDTAIMVGDRGMIKTAQIDLLSDKENFHYITAITKPQIETLVKKKIIQMELFDNTVCEVADGDLRYILRRNPIRVKEIWAARQGKLESVQRFCCKKNTYLTEHPRAHVKVATRNIEEKIRKLKLGNWCFVETNDRHLTIKTNEQKLEEDSRFDGCYAIKTDLSSKQASKEIVHDRYKSLAEVEWAFRTMKTTLLHLRGIFVRKANRTKAHVFIIMLAYLISYELRRLWRDIDVTIEDAMDELSTICANKVLIGKTCIHTIPTPRELGQKLLNKAQITLPEAIQCGSDFVYTTKSLIDERRTVLK
jgi:transposase